MLNLVVRRETARILRLSLSSSGMFHHIKWHVALKMEALFPSETSVAIYQSVQRNIPAIHNVYTSKLSYFVKLFVVIKPISCTNFSYLFLK
jgi:hypothetical protein